MEDQGTIENLLVDHFKKSNEGTIIASLEYMLNEIQALPIPQLSSQQNLTLNYPIINWEIESTIFQLGSHKAPRLDGIPTFLLGLLGNYEELHFNIVRAFLHSDSLVKSLTIPLSP